MSGKFDYLTLQTWVNDALEDHPGLSGMVAYSGRASWQRAKYMILGFNPAADGTNENLTEIAAQPDSWSLYSDKCWVCGERREEGHRHQLTRHQKTVHELCEAIGIPDPREIFATNAIFAESKDIKSLPNWPELFERCWRVHIRFLEVIQPRWIICLGNSDTASSFSLLRKKMNEVSPIEFCGRNYRDGKLFVGNLSAGTWTGKVSVLGIPHPSRFSLTQALRDFLTKELN